jgi:hypothetical protein
MAITMRIQAAISAKYLHSPISGDSQCLEAALQTLMQKIAAIARDREISRPTGAV